MNESKKAYLDTVYDETPLKSMAEKKAIIFYAEQNWQGHGRVIAHNNCSGGYLIILLEEEPGHGTGALFGEDDIENMKKYIRKHSSVIQTELF